MRIGWVTPFNERSSIARYARDVVTEMHRRGVDVQVFRSEVGQAAQLPLIESEFRVHTFNDFGIEQLKSSFDLFVVTIADHFEFNCGSLDILRAIPSVGVFHDADVRHLALGMMESSGIGEAQLSRFRTIGSTVPSTEPPFGEDLAWLATLCTGAVFHSPHYGAPLTACCPGPTLLVPLCHADPGPPAPGRRDDAFTIVTFGNLNANKQADRVLRALAQSEELRGRAIYRLVGAITPAEQSRLLALANELELSPPIFDGWVAEERLQEILGQAHVICCLRYPILEGGSGSLIFATVQRKSGYRSRRGNLR